MVFDETLDEQKKKEQLVDTEPSVATEETAPPTTSLPPLPTAAAAPPPGAPEHDYRSMYASTTFAEPTQDERIGYRKLETVRAKAAAAAEPAPDRTLEGEIGASAGRGLVSLAEMIPQAVKIVGADIMGSKTVEELMVPVLDSLEAMKTSPTLRPGKQAGGPAIELENVISDPKGVAKQVMDNVGNAYFWASQVPEQIGSWGSMFGGGLLVRMGAKALKYGKLIKAAEAIGDLEKASALTTRLNKMGTIGQYGAGIALEAGEAEQRLRDYELTNPDVSHGKRILAIMGTGIVAGSLEAMSLEKIFHGRTGMNLWKQILEGVATEGSTEAAQGVVENAFEKIGYNPEQKLLEGVVEAALIGAVMGGAGGGVSGAIDANRTRIENKIRLANEERARGEASQAEWDESQGYRRGAHRATTGTATFGTTEEAIAEEDFAREERARTTPEEHQAADTGLGASGPMEGPGDAAARETQPGPEPGGPQEGPEATGPITPPEPGPDTGPLPGGETMVPPGVDTEAEVTQPEPGLGTMRPGDETTAPPVTGEVPPVAGPEATTGPVTGETGPPPVTPEGPAPTTGPTGPTAGTETTDNSEYHARIDELPANPETKAAMKATIDSAPDAETKAGVVDVANNMLTDPKYNEAVGNAMEHVYKSRQEGKSDEELLKNLTDAGWPPHEAKALLHIQKHVADMEAGAAPQGGAEQGAPEQGGGPQAGPTKGPKPIVGAPQGTTGPPHKKPEKPEGDGAAPVGGTTKPGPKGPEAGPAAPVGEAKGKEWQPVEAHKSPETATARAKKLNDGKTGSQYEYRAKEGQVERRKRTEPRPPVEPGALPEPAAAEKEAPKTGKAAPEMTDDELQKEHRELFEKARGKSERTPEEDARIKEITHERVYRNAKKDFDEAKGKGYTADEAKYGKDHLHKRYPGDNSADAINRAWKETYGEEAAPEGEKEAPGGETKKPAGEKKAPEWEMVAHPGGQAEAEAQAKVMGDKDTKNEYRARQDESGQWIVERKKGAAKGAGEGTQPAPETGEKGTKEAEGEQVEDAAASVKLSKEFEKMLAQAVFKHDTALTTQQVINKAKEHLGIKQDDLYRHRKLIEEALELAVVNQARAIIDTNDAAGVTNAETLAQLEKLYNYTPAMRTRTSESILAQAYSTPAPLAFLMGRATGLNLDSTLYEPTAGNGMLTIGADVKNIHVNELNKTRLDHLKSQGFGKVTSEDAMNYDYPGVKVDVVHVNSPFGSIPKMEFDGFVVKKLEHLITMRALQAMKDNGRAAFIIGGHSFADNLGNPTAALSGTERTFFNYIYSHYNVVAHINVAGKLYERMGTKFPIRVLVVAGRKATVAGVAPMSADQVSNADTFEKVHELLKGVIENAEQQESVGPEMAGEQPGSEGGAGGSGTAGQGTSERPGVEKPLGGAGTEGVGPGRGPGEHGTDTGGKGDGRPVGDEGGGASGPTGQPLGGALEPVIRGTQGESEGQGQAGGNIPPGGPGKSGGGTGGTQGGESKRPGDGRGGNRQGENESGAIKKGWELVPGAIYDTMAEAEARAAEGRAANDEYKYGAQAIAGDKFATIRKAKPAAGAPKQPKQPKQPKWPVTDEDKRLKKILDNFETWFKSAGWEKEGYPNVIAFMKSFQDPANRQRFRDAVLAFAVQGKTKAQAQADARKKRGESQTDQEKAQADFFDRILREADEAFGNDTDWEQMKKEAKAEAQARAEEDAAADEIRQGQEQDTELQEFYESASTSNGTKIGTVAPKNMREAMQNAVLRFEQDNGPVDTFLLEKLKYSSYQALYEALAVEQIETVALTIREIERGQGFVMGHQTGVGKGRCCAAIMRYARLQGKTPIFVTAKPNLFQDMYRDLLDTGSGDFKPLLVASSSKENPATIVNPETEQPVFQVNAAMKRAQKAAYDSGQMPEGFDGVFTTYAMFQKDIQQVATPVPGRGVVTGLHYPHNSKFSFLKGLADNNIVILDEAHEAAGGDTGRAISRTQKGMSNRCAYFMHILENASGVMYSSATFAKRAGAMPLYYRTAINNAGIPYQQLMDHVMRLGVPGQEWLSQQLAQEGQMARLETSYKGIKAEPTIDTDNKARDAERVDGVTTFFRDIVDLDEIKTHELLPNLTSILNPGGGGTGSNQSMRVDVASTTFASRVHNAIKQMMFAMRAEASIDMAVDLMVKREWTYADGETRQFENGQKPFIAVFNTMDALVSSMVESGTVAVGDKFDPDFRSVVLKNLDSLRYVSITNPQGQKERHYLTDQELQALSPAFWVRYNEIKAAVKEADNLAALTAMPIDYIKREIKSRAEAKFKEMGLPDRKVNVGEITGRKYEIVENQGVRTLQDRKIGSKNSRNAVMRDYNSGKIDVVIVNTAGFTGMSAHSSKKFKDQTPRAMVVAQLPDDINAVMQGMGRINRTGQAHLPAYHFISSALPAETRPMMVLTKKLRSLSANVSANEKTWINLDVQDTLNDFGDEALAQVLIDDLGLEGEWYSVLGDPLDLQNQNPNNPGQVNAPGPATNYRRGGSLMAKVTGKIAIQPVAMQDAFWEELNKKYVEITDYYKLTGEYNLQSQALDLQAEEINKELLASSASGVEGYSDLSNHAFLVKMRVKNLTKPLTQEQLNEKVDKVLGERKQRVEEERAKAQTALTEMGKLVKQSEQRLSELNTEHRTLQDRIYYGQGELSGLEQQARQVENDLNALRSAKLIEDDIKDFTDMAEAATEPLKKENFELRAERARDELQRHIEAEKRLADIMEKVATLRAEIEAAPAKLQKVREERDLARTQNKENNRAYDKLDRDLEMLNRPFAAGVIYGNELADQIQADTEAWLEETLAPVTNWKPVKNEEFDTMEEAEERAAERNAATQTAANPYVYRAEKGKEEGKFIVSRKRQDDPDTRPGRPNADVFRQGALQAMNDVTDAFRSRWIIGKSYNISVGNSGEYMSAVLYNITYKPGKRYNPATPNNFSLIFALNNPMQQLPVQLHKAGEWNISSAHDDYLATWDTITPQEGYEERFMATGNLLLVPPAILNPQNNSVGRGKMTFFTRKDGSTEAGIFLPRGFTDQMAGDIPVSLSADEIIPVLTSGQVRELRYDPRDVTLRADRHGRAYLWIPGTQAGSREFITPSAWVSQGEPYATRAEALAEINKLRSAQKANDRTEYRVDPDGDKFVISQNAHDSLSDLSEDKQFLMSSRGRQRRMYATYAPENVARMVQILYDRFGIRFTIGRGIYSTIFGQNQSGTMAQEHVGLTRGWEYVKREVNKNVSQKDFTELRQGEAEIAFGSMKEFNEAITQASKEVQDLYIPNFVLVDTPAQEAPIARELRVSKRIDLTGRTLTPGSEAHDLAQLWQVYRNEKMEIMHTIYTDEKGTILAHHAITCGLVDMVQPKDMAKFLHEVDSRGERMGAAKVHILHNHPSGDPGLSKADIQTAHNLRFGLKHPKLGTTIMKGLGDHMGEFVVIDHGEYGYMSPYGYWGKSALGDGPEPLGGMNRLRSYQDLAQFGHFLQYAPSDRFIAVYITAKNEIRGWTAHHKSMLAKPGYDTHKAFLQEIKRNRAAGVYILSGDATLVNAFLNNHINMLNEAFRSKDTAKIYEALDHQLHNWLRDIVGERGESIQMDHPMGKDLFKNMGRDKRDSSRALFEETAPLSRGDVAAAAADESLLRSYEAAHVAAHEETAPGGPKTWWSSGKTWFDRQFKRFYFQMVSQTAAIESVSREAETKVRQGVNLPPGQLPEYAGSQYRGQRAWSDQAVMGDVYHDETVSGLVTKETQDLQQQMDDEIAEKGQISPRTLEKFSKAMARKFFSGDQVKKGAGLNKRMETLRKLAEKRGENTWNDFWRVFMVAQRDLELAGEYGNRMPGDIKGVTPEESREALAALERKYGADMAAFHETANGVREWADEALMQPLVTVGLMDEETYSQIKDSNMFYTPFFRLMEEMEEKGYVASNANMFEIRNLPIKAIKGSEKQILDPLESLIKMLYNVGDIYGRAKVARTLAELPLFSDVGPEIRMVRAKFFKVPIMLRQEVDPKLRTGLEKVLREMGVDVKVKARLRGLRSDLAKFRKTIQGEGLDSEELGYIEQLFGSTEKSLAHAMGHAIDAKYNLVDLFMADKTMQIELRKIADQRTADTSSAGFRQFVRQRKEQVSEFVNRYINANEVARRLAPQTTKAFEQLIGENAELKDLLRLRPTFQIGTREHEDTAWVRSAFAPQPNTAMVHVDGKAYWVKLDKDLYEAVKSLTAHEVSILEKIMRAPASYLRAGAVLSPEFIARNWFRDVIQARMLSRYGFSLRGWLGDVFRVIGKDEEALKIWDKWEAGGGPFGTSAYALVDMPKVDAENIRNGGTKKVYYVSHPLEALRAVSGFFENITRYSVYRQAMDKGASHAEAIHEARTVTIDFARHGAHPIARALAMMVPFWGASVQGIDRVGQALADKEQRPQVLKRVFFGITLPSILLWMLFHDDDRLKELEGWEKNYFWHIPLGKDGPIIRMPKPFELGIGFGSTVERMLDFAKTGDAAGLKGVLAAMADAATPNMMPAIARPFVEGASNWNFFMGRPIEDASMANLPKELRSKPWTLELSKATSIGMAKAGVPEWARLSPVMMEHFIRAMGGGLAANYFMPGLDLVMRKAGVLDDIPQPQQDLMQQMWGIRAYMSKEPTGSRAKSVGDFFESYQRVIQADQGWKHYWNVGNVKEADAFLADHPEAVFARVVRKEMDNLGKIKKERNKIMVHPTMDPEVKRQRLDRLDAEVVKIAQRVNIMVNDGVAEKVKLPKRSQGGRSLDLDDYYKVMAIGTQDAYVELSRSLPRMTEMDSDERATKIAAVINRSMAEFKLPTKPEDEVLKGFRFKDLFDTPTRQEKEHWREITGSKRVSAGLATGFRLRVDKKEGGL